jgi:cobalt-precorrin-5B (C1)-methyltransferase
MATKASPLRRGWTTGTCATAAAKAAYTALLTGEFPDPVEVTLPRGGGRPAFALATTVRGEGSATAGVVKDAGDDPDVTHGALVLTTVRRGAGLASAPAKASAQSRVRDSRCRRASPPSTRCRGR